MESVMTLKNKLELRLNDDPPYWKGNRPPTQVPPTEIPAGPRSAPEIPISSGNRTVVEPPTVRAPDDLPPQD
jgi:hypothetical protein